MVKPARSAPLRGFGLDKPITADTIRPSRSRIKQIPISIHASIQPKAFGSEVDERFPFTFSVLYSESVLCLDSFSSSIYPAVIIPAGSATIAIPNTEESIVIIFPTVETA